MYTYEFRFYPQRFDAPEVDEFDCEMRWYLSSLSKNGQILDACQNTVKLRDCYACRVVAPELDSLEERYKNSYTAKFLKSLEALSAKPPELLFIGENYDIPDCCTCGSPSHYILYAECISDAPPVLCGDCKRPVPLYKLPKTYDNEEYYDLLGWQKAYKACDWQFMEGIGERHGYRMMHDPNSPLSKEALSFCATFEGKVGKPFYYFLFQYYRKNGETCPKCGKPWSNPEPDKVRYDCVCHGCRLVSNDP